MKTSKLRHPAELHTRRMLLRYPDLLKLADIFIDAKKTGGISWPEWCYFPMGAAYSIITEGASMEDAMSILIKRGGALELALITSALTWRRSKFVYRFDRTLAQALRDQTIQGDLPAEALKHLPALCVFIEGAGAFADKNAYGFFAWLESDHRNPETPELRLLYLFPHQQYCNMQVILSGTLADARRALIASAAQVIIENNFESIPGSEMETTQASEADVTEAINMLLYLCSDKPDFAEASYPPPRSKPTSAKRKDIPADNEITIVDVGQDIGARIRKFHATRSVQGSHDATGTGKQRAPHIRSAHWHSYWMGAVTDRRLTIKWLPPIPVNLDEGKETPTTIIKVDFPAEEQKDT